MRVRSSRPCEWWQGGAEAASPPLRPGLPGRAISLCLGGLQTGGRSRAIAAPGLRITPSRARVPAISSEGLTGRCRRAGTLGHVICWYASRRLHAALLAALPAADSGRGCCLRLYPPQQAVRQVRGRPACELRSLATCQRARARASVDLLPASGPGEAPARRAPPGPGRVAEPVCPSILSSCASFCWVCSSW